jgi:hypothetical protein
VREHSLSRSAFVQEHSLLNDALTYCDMTTSSTGEQITFQERIKDICSRYDNNHIVHKAISAAAPSLTQIVQRAEQELLKQDL